MCNQGGQKKKRQEIEANLHAGAEILRHSLLGFASMLAMKRLGVWVGIGLAAAAAVVSCSSPARKKTGATGGMEEEPGTGGAVATGGSRTGGMKGSTGGSGGSTGGSGGSAGIELKMAWWGSPTRAERTNMVAKMFEAKNPGITIKTEFYATTQGMGIVGTDYWPTLNDYAMKGTLPDIMQHDYAYIEEWTGRNLLRELDDLIADGTLKLTDVPQGLIDGGKVGGKVMAVSLGTNTQAVAIDVDLFTELAIPIPSDEWTWEDFESIAMQIKMKKGIFGAGSGLWGYTPGWKAVYLSMGQWVFSPDGKALGYTDDKPWIDHFNMLVRLKKAAAIPSIMEEPTGGNVDTLLMVTKKSGMEHIFSNQLVGLANAATAANMMMPRKFKLLPLPKVKGQRSPIYMKPSQYFAVTATSQHAKEAAKVIDFFTNDVDANNILKGERGVPVNTKVLEAVKTTLDATAADSFDLIKRGDAYATKLPPNDPPPWTQLLTTILTPISKKIMNEEVTVEAGVADFRTQATALLSATPVPDGGVVDANTADGGVTDAAAPDAGADGSASDVAVGTQVLIITGAVEDGVDMQVRMRLAQSWPVVVLPELMAQSDDANGKALVVITASASVAGTGNKFNDTTTPVLLMEPNLLGSMGMTAIPDTAHNTTPMQTQITIVAEATNPLVGGLTGNVRVYDMPYRMVWGIPGNQAIKVATVLNQPTQLAIFAYPSEAQMVGRTAPGRRLSFFAHNNPIATNITENGLKLLDAAVDWLTAP
jgi:multiple sugar transport system substrate-binding protein